MEVELIHKEVFCNRATLAVTWAGGLFSVSLFSKGDLRGTFATHDGQEAFDVVGEAREAINGGVSGREVGRSGHRSDPEANLIWQ